MHAFEGFLGGILAATLAIIVSEIVFNYGLGDFLKDLAVSIFGKAKSLAEARYNRLTAKVAKIRAAL